MHWLKNLQKDFLWDSLGNEFKLHLVIWKKIYESIQHGRLGKRSSVSFNQVLFGKWLLRFATEKDVFWRKVVDKKYMKWLEEGDWCLMASRDPYFICLWKHIIRGWGKFSNCITFEVGNGTNIHLWHDRWLGDGCLKDTFPEPRLIYKCSNKKKATVADYMIWKAGHLHCDVTFLFLFLINIVMSPFLKLSKTGRCMS